MAKSITEYNIFLASPSDLEEERDSINDVINELNITYGKSRSLVIKLLKWETHSAPAITLSNTQDIISNDIGDSYDLFIGMLWKKFGTPTKNANSGTEEEFLIAYEKYKQRPNDIQILIYFKTGQVNINEIDIEQLAKVRNFQKLLGEKNVLHWEFSTINSLQGFLRMHIPLRIDELISKTQQSKSTEVFQSKAIAVVEEEYEELGLIDYQEISISSFGEAERAMLELTDATEWVGRKIIGKTKELNKLNSSKQQLGIKEIRNHCQSTAEILNDYSSRVDLVVPNFVDNFDSGIKSVSQMIVLSGNDYTEEAESLHSTIINLHPQMSSAIDELKKFCIIISELPRIEKQFNKARNTLEKKLTHLVNQMEIGLTLAEELIKQYEIKYDIN